MTWTESQRVTMYQANLIGLRPDAIADRLGVPTAAVTTHLRGIHRSVQLDVILEHTRRTVTDGHPHPLAGLDPKTLSIADLIATAEKSGTSRTKQTALRLRNQIERIKYQLIADRDSAADRARLAELRVDLAIARKKTKDIEDRIRKIQGKSGAVSGSAVDRHATGGRGTRHGPADPETPTGQ